jgi:putative transposase
MFVSVPPHVAISDLMQRAKERSSYKIQLEFPENSQALLGAEILGPRIFLHHQW